jgi:hypothetical protein
VALPEGGRVMLLVSGGTADVRPLIHARPDLFGTLAVPRDGNALPEVGRWAADNGAFSDFDPAAFKAMLARHRYARDRCLFVAAPDVVGDADATLAKFDGWAPTIRALGYPLALVAQDGLRPDHVPWHLVAAIFIGGTTGWKLSSSAAHVIEAARLRGRWIHMGRVNTRRRLHYAAALGVDSVDGSGWSRFPRAMLERHGALLRTLSEQRRLLLRGHPHWRAVTP